MTAKSRATNSGTKIIRRRNKHDGRVGHTQGHAQGRAASEGMFPYDLSVSGGLIFIAWTEVWWFTPRGGPL